ncbi:MAG: helix-turn-helix transcriptional regulator [Cytophagales bacterium]|nr:helix-turn-helix transcriptional regulator [Cytophagales bacterium]
MNWTSLALIIALLWIAFTWVRANKRKLKSKKEKNGSELDEKLLEQIFNRASSALVQEKLYLKKNIRIADLAIHLAQNEKLVSRAINRHTKVNFNTYVNNFRVEHSKELITSGKFDHYTIEAISDESGFSNKVSFYQAFKTNVGISPSEFRAQKQPKK